jgi:hypothetical protein
LTDVHRGDDVIDETGGRLRHAASATGGAKPSPFTREGHQGVLGTGPAPQT